MNNIAVATALHEGGVSAQDIAIAAQSYFVRDRQSETKTTTSAIEAIDRELTNVERLFNEDFEHGRVIMWARFLSDQRAKGNEFTIEELQDTINDHYSSRRPA